MKPTICPVTGLAKGNPRASPACSLSPGRYDLPLIAGGINEKGKRHFHIHGRNIFNLLILFCIS